MNSKIEKYFKETLHHLYINPLEKCNLRCKICYTKKTGDVLTEEKIINFIDRYKQVEKLETITFCGGEVFLLPYFIRLVNKLTDDGIFVQIITNGTVNRLNLITNPNLVNLIVSIDGLEQIHDANRGVGSYQKSLAFLLDALKQNFHIEIFSIVHQDNYQQIDLFESQLKKQFSFLPEITYHPRKPLAYLTGHPTSNIFGETNQFNFLNDQQMIEIMENKKTFPPPNLGCYQIALTSNGSVFGCCEGTIPIGTIDEPVADLVSRLKSRVDSSINDLSTISMNSSSTKVECLGCSQADFVCGIKKYLTILNKSNKSSK
ncbi:MAG: radical SAM protein [Patescibacteria group bacterium]